MAIYDYHAHLGLWRLGLRPDEKPGLYGRYMELVEQCRAELREHGHGEWTAREVDLALFTHGQDESRPRARPWRDKPGLSRNGAHEPGALSSGRPSPASAHGDRQIDAQPETQPTTGEADTN